MSSFEPTIILFGSPTRIGSVHFRLPVSSLFAFDVSSLEQIVNITPQLCDSCLNRYFIILLDSIDEELLIRLKTNHRIISIYNQQQITNSFKQFTLDITNDIVHFLTCEGEKQFKLERIFLVNIYYQQSRILKEWAMAFFKAEPCHILLISLNSTQQNLDSAQQRLQHICTTLGYSSSVIRQVNDYIPHNENHVSLFPYAKLLFNNEKPSYMCQMIKKLSPIRFYLYGNELCSLSEWSNLMIGNEKEIMDDEDNWITFIENEYIDNDVKWNFAFMYAQNWKVSRVSPLDLNQLKDDPRFHSALRRSHLTFAQRQIEVTSEIFNWYNNCIERGYLHLEPKLSSQQIIMKSKHRMKTIDELETSCIFRDLSSFDYSHLDSTKIKSISFIWLDEILYDLDGEFHEIIEPFQWNFFDNISLCISFIERQLREQRYIFLIVSGTLGQQLFSTTFSLRKQIFASYVYCAHLGPHLDWSQKYPQIRGVYNDYIKLSEQIKRDYNQLKNSLDINQTNWNISSTNIDENKILYQLKNIESSFGVLLIVYNPEESQLFFGHQRTIDTLLCMPHTYESKVEMINEFRRIYNGNEMILSDIDHFQKTYHSNAAVQWYTRDSFICRTINQSLRSSNVDMMFKLRYILIDIYSHLNQSYQQNQSFSRQITSQIFYRGQFMSNQQFYSFKELQGEIISINTFLSTTKSMQIALMYAGKYIENSDFTSVVFSIERDSIIDTRPYANISPFSLFPDEEEVLFAMGSIFRIGNIRQLTNADHIWIIHLKMTDQQDYQFNRTSSTTS